MKKESHKKKSTRAEIGLIGLAVMGANLARNISNKGFPVIVFNRTTEKTEKFIDVYGGKNLTGAKTLKEFVSALSSPRKIILMVQAGDPVDMVLNDLIPLLSKGDIVIDCGNSNYRDTQKRFQNLQKKGLHFIGCGVSGGEEGALHGPSLMPGGEKSAFQKIEKILTKIAAKDFQNHPCVSFIGENGAGHYVKMVHNGIEYGVMQLMSEAYEILRKIYKLNALQISEIFKKLDRSPLSSYLFEIAAKVLAKKDDLNKGFLIDKILDKAGQKGTGMWTAIDALSRGISLPSITESVFARAISGEKDLRQKLSKISSPGRNLNSENNFSKLGPLDNFIDILENALYAGMLITYAQGYDLIQKAAKEENWKIDLAEISRIWQGGCIIRAKILDFLHKSYRQKSATKITQNFHLLEIPEIKNSLQKTIPSLRQLAVMAINSNISVPVFCASLSYFDAITSENLPANFIQGLRDFFGAHGYERTDNKGNFHTKWE